MSGGKGYYEVGKGKPPKSTQFKPGQSGNPTGRPKGRKDFLTEIDKILNAPVQITENGETRTVSSREATLLRLRKKALEGDARSMDRLLELARQHAAEQEAASTERRLSGLDEDILQRYVDCHSGAHGQLGHADDKEDGDDSSS